MQLFLNDIKETFKNTETSLITTYTTIYVLWGIAMNAFGTYAEIARFEYWWQIITCYVFYMIPISILLKKHTFFTQYAYGLVAMGVLEFLGYALQTSYAYPDNILDQFFQPQNFSLAMAMFFALYFPIGNYAVAALHRKVFKTKTI